MKAIVYTEYGTADVLQVKELDIPKPKDNEILIRVRATPVNFADILVRHFNTITPGKFSMPGFLWLPSRLIFGFNKPKVQTPGSEFAGDVAAVGSAVTKFKKGDAVIGYRGMKMGTNAEYVCMAETDMVARKPVKMSYEEAATIPYGGLTALSILRRLNIQPGQKVLVLGASGSIGSHAVQIARHYGAEVTGVCGTPRLEMVKALGADHVIDYTQEDFTANGEVYDLIIDVLGKGSLSQSRRSLAPDGRYVMVSFKTRHLLQMWWTSMRGGQKVLCLMSEEAPGDLDAVSALAEAGTLRGIIDRCYPLEEAADAHRYFESGGKTGSIILSIAPAG